jgi:hypothetical protein
MKNEIFLGSGNNFTIQQSKNVELRETLTLLDENEKPIQLEVNIEADFGNIPEKYHEVFLNMMTVKYYNRVSFGHNPFSQCLPPQKKKWWEFWKANLNI